MIIFVIQYRIEPFIDDISKSQAKFDSYFIIPSRMCF